MPPTSADNEDNRMIDPLPEDNATPFSPPDSPSTDPTQVSPIENPSAEIDDTHQATDTGMEAAEVYDEGISGAAEATEPNAGNAVTGYNPDDDSRVEEQAL